VQFCSWISELNWSPVTGAEQRVTPFACKNVVNSGGFYLPPMRSARQWRSHKSTGCVIGSVLVQGTGEAICVFLSVEFVGFCEGQHLGPPTDDDATQGQDTNQRSL
jgi:hypothetical protein